MDFDLKDDQRHIQQTTRDLVARALAPRASEIDRDASLPSDVLQTLADAGLFGLTIAEQHGGRGGDLVSFALAIEEIAAACASTAALVGAHITLVCRALQRAGSDEQKRRILPALSRGASLGAAFVPDVSAPSTMTTLVAEPDGKGGFFLDGEVCPVTAGRLATFFLVFATITPSRDQRDHQPSDPQLVALVLHRDLPGLEIVPIAPDLGRRAAGAATLRARKAHVDQEDVLGTPDSQGSDSELTAKAIAIAASEDARIAVAAEAVGVARAALEQASSCIKQTQTPPVNAGLLGTHAMIADMAVEVSAARLLVLHAAHLADLGVPSSAERAVAKLFATEMATRVTHRAVQILGARKASGSEGLARHFRDARMTELVEESSEIQRTIIAQALLRA